MLFIVSYDTNDHEEPEVETVEASSAQEVFHTFLKGRNETVKNWEILANDIYYIEAKHMSYDEVKIVVEREEL